LFRGTYWPAKLTGIFAKIAPDVIVTDLGINDAAWGGDLAGYGIGIDRYMGGTNGHTVLWTNLPVTLEPAKWQTTSALVNQALTEAVARWPNLVVLDWNTAATGHPEYMNAPGTDVHLSPTGAQAWSTLVVNELDARFPG
jgi:hypothetical protein